MFCVKLLLLVVVITLAAAQHESESKNVETFIVKGHNAKRGQFPCVDVWWWWRLWSIADFRSMACHGGASRIQRIFYGRAFIGALKAKDTNERGRKIYFISAKDIHVHPRYSKPAIRK